MKNYIVYKHTSPNGKVYIGCTRFLDRFRYGNGYHPTAPFGKAIKEFGWNNFTHEILYSDLSQDEAFAKEIELIAFYQSNNPEYGYNRSVGGKKSALGYKHSEEAKMKIGKATILNKTGKQLTEEHKQHLRENHADFNGVKHPRSKFTQCQIDDIRKVYKPHDKKFGAIALSKKYGVCPETIQNIVRKHTYKV